MRQFRWVLVLMLMVIGPLCPMAGAAIQAGEEIFVTAPVPKNAYLFAGRVVVIERLQADGVLAGGSILINAPVRRDLLAAGGEVLVNAAVGGNVRVAGGSITINGEVGGDLVMAGGRVIIGPGSRVLGDLLVAGGEVVIDGTIAGDLRAAGGRITFNGEVGGASHFRASDLSLNGHLIGPAEFAGENIALGPAARFEAEVAYWHPDGEIVFGPALAPEGRAVLREDLRFDAPRHSLRETGRRAIFAWVSLSFLSGAATLLLLVFLAPGFTRLAGQGLVHAFWPKTGAGLLYFLATPLLALLLMLTLVGLPLGLFLLCLYLFSLLFVAPLTAVVLVRWLEQRRNGHWSRGKITLVGLALFLAVKLLLYLPLVGWLLVLIPVCAAFGALLAADWRCLTAGDRL